MVAPFEKKYGIKVKVWRAGSDKVLQRTVTETNGKRYEVDAIHISAPEMEALHTREGAAAGDQPGVRQPAAGHRCRRTANGPRRC